MEAYKLNKKLLIVIEGPAGSGKSDLCRALHVLFHQHHFKVHLLHEFSPTKLGRILARELACFRHASETDDALQEMTFCLADKYSYLHNISISDQFEILIMDRGFITQHVLAIPRIQSEEDKYFSQSLITQYNEWMHKKFYVFTFFLKLSLETNMIRLKKREGIVLKDEDIQLMKGQHKLYSDQAKSPIVKANTTFQLDAEQPTSALANQILKMITEDFCLT